MQAVGKIRHLNGVVQHYTWGGFDFIPNLLGIENKDHIPFAEYWLGAHPNFPSLIKGKGFLNNYISQRPTEVLGERVASRFDTLPYLLKVLDVHKMLSIQVHPDKASAKKGFKYENDLGIAITAANRNYKDENHKPELMVALGDFYLLHGFKPVGELRRVLDAVQEFNFLKEIFDAKGYKGLYETVMLMDQLDVNKILLPLVKKLVRVYKNNELKKEDEGYWVAQAALNFCNDENYDRGIFSVYFFNLLHLKRGEGIYQPAGMPHAYLEGQNVEVMANSDNVLRAGLTDKHIDVPELMKHIVFQETIPNVITFPQGKNHRVFASPAQEFELHQYELAASEAQQIIATAGEIWLVMQGAVEIEEEGKKSSLKKGEAILVEEGAIVDISCQTISTVFRVGVPLG